MSFFQIPGACDCHSHVFGPFSFFPLSAARTFDPPESPVEALERIWSTVGIDRAVIVQGSAHGGDHSALLHALSRAPERRRGVALLNNEVSDACLTQFHEAGIRAVRFNWVRHLLARGTQTVSERLKQAALLAERIVDLGWHIEIHIDMTDLDSIDKLRVPVGMPIVIDHMARVDVAAPDNETQIRKLLDILKRDHIWLKISGADRIAIRNGDLRGAGFLMRSIIQTAPERCVWGLDWPHVNLEMKFDDTSLARFLEEICGDRETLRSILVRNPDKLYGFPSL
jgi:predicted TIM-barrel fold metal-dependent hydrolase